jgi:hypothetical protein
MLPNTTLDAALQRITAAERRAMQRAAHRAEKATRPRHGRRSVPAVQTVVCCA